MTYSNKFEAFPVAELVVASKYEESRLKSVIWLAWNRECNWIDLVVNPITLVGSYLGPPLN